MVLFALEKALGDYVAEINEQTADIPEELRENVRGRAMLGSEDRAAASSVRSLLAQSYLGDVLDMALATSVNRHDHQHLKGLRDLLGALRAFDIRNAVCHPNRPFPECFWHRTGAIATDPAIEALRFKTVTEAFRATQQGRTSSPPTEWLSQPVWAVANNLPDAFDHEVTGLIGRRKEAAALVKTLANPRISLTAIIGPGGSGKTAICLQVLRDLTCEPTTLDWCDEIVYVTAKTERLTAQGIQPIDDPVDSLESLRTSIIHALDQHNDLPEATTFDSAAEQLSKRRILLCLDNLETILRDHPETFDDFVFRLPPDWKVLVTSRITVNSATIIPIGAIAEGAAQQLARDYLLRRGGDALAKETIAALAAACDYNPLAIRLALDSYLAGAELRDALTETRANVIAFSYERLLDALPRPSIDVLECLFSVGDRVTRAEIGSFLGLQIDDVADAIAHLLRTSLVTRHGGTDVERYGLSSSVRELLLRLPRNPDVRRAVYDRLRRQRREISTLPTASSVDLHDALSWNYLPNTAPDHVKVVALKVFRALRLRGPRTDLVTLLDELDDAILRDPDDPLLHRAKGHLLVRIEDRYGAMQSLKKACDCARDDPASALALAKHLLREHRLDEAHDYSQRLLDAGWADPSRSSVENIRELLKTHWLSAIWAGQWEAAKRGCSDWRNAGDLRATLACLYVSALRRSHESVARVESVESDIESIFKCLAEVIAIDGYPGFLVHEALQVLRWVRQLLPGLHLSPECCSSICVFADRHLEAICGIHRGTSLDDDEVRILVQRLGELECAQGENPLRREHWRNVTAEPDDPALREYGFNRATIYSRPKRADGTQATYLFARDSDGNEYYVTRMATGLGRPEFEALRVGDTLSVRPEEEREEGKAWRVREAIPLRLSSK